MIRQPKGTVKSIIVVLSLSMFIQFVTKPLKEDKTSWTVPALICTKIFYHELLKMA